jgi:hypothetical protein
MKIEGHIDQSKYQHMLLDSGVLIDMNNLYGPSGWLFMDDGAPVIEHIPLKHFSHYIAAYCQKTLHGLFIPLI